MAADLEGAQRRLTNEVGVLGQTEAVYGLTRFMPSKTVVPLPEEEEDALPELLPEAAGRVVLR